MTKIMSINKIEHEIEGLPPVDQLKLLEWLAKHLKQVMLELPTVRQHKASTETVISTRGALKQYANPSLREREGAAFAQAMKGKHATR